MRILPIQSYPRNYQPQKLANTNQSRFMSNQLSSDVFVRNNNVNNNSTINFGNINKTALSCVKDIPLEDKLASIFDVFKRGELKITKLKGIWFFIKMRQVRLRF